MKKIQPRFVRVDKRKRYVRQTEYLDDGVHGYQCLFCGEGFSTQERVFDVSWRNSSTGEIHPAELRWKYCPRCGCEWEGFLLNLRDDDDDTRHERRMRSVPSKSRVGLLQVLHVVEYLREDGEMEVLHESSFARSLTPVRTLSEGGRCHSRQTWLQSVKDALRTEIAERTGYSRFNKLPEPDHSGYIRHEFLNDRVRVRAFIRFDRRPAFLPDRRPSDPDRPVGQKCFMELRFVGDGPGYVQGALVKGGTNNGD